MGIVRANGWGLLFYQIDFKNDFPIQLLCHHNFNSLNGSIKPNNEMNRIFLFCLRDPTRISFSINVKTDLKFTNGMMTLSVVLF